MFVFQSFPLSPCIVCFALGTLRGLICRDTLSSTPFQCLGWRRLVETCDTRKAPCRRHDFTFTPGHLECHGCQTSNWNNKKNSWALFTSGHPRQPTPQTGEMMKRQQKYSLTHPAIFHYLL